MQMIIGEKLGMTRVFSKDNKSIAVTLVSAKPNTIISLKNIDKDGYNAVQIGYGNKKSITKPIKNHIKKAKLESVKSIKEFKINKDEIDKYKVGESITVASFKEGQKVNIIGVSKGKGFAGVMKRHGFSGMPASHGHEKQRIPGSIGCRYPQRTIKGKRMAGQMGNKQITIKNTVIVNIDKDNNILAIKGSIPGSNNNLLQIISK